MKTWKSYDEAIENIHDVNIGDYIESSDNGKNGGLITRVNCTPSLKTSELEKLVSFFPLEQQKKALEVITDAFWERIIHIGQNAAYGRPRILPFRLSMLVEQLCFTNMSMNEQLEYKEIMKNKELISKLSKKLLSLISEQKIEYEILMDLEFECENPSETLQKLKDSLEIIQDLNPEIKLDLRGRPSLEQYYCYIESMAKLYEEISEQRFSLLRQKDSQGLYLSVTDGHRFAELATELIHGRLETSQKGFTDKNLLNACERAVKNMRPR
jgi:hypothetical protein